MPVISLYQSRSLGIHVEELDEFDDGELIQEKGEVVEDEEEDEDEDLDEVAKGRKKMQLVMIYSLHLADAIMIASIQPQLYIMLKDHQLCGSSDSTYWTGVVESIFAVGSIAGLFWGWVGDRIGRRPIALMGLLGMFLSCIAMGFSTSALSCAIIRGFSGFVISSIRVMAWTMTGDISRTKKTRARNFSRMPLVALGGIIGPVLQAALSHRFAEDNPLWKRFPILSSQIAFSVLMFIVLVLNYVFLDETLPVPNEEEYSAEAQPLAYSHNRRDSLSEFHSEKNSYHDSDTDSLDSPVLFRRRRPVFYNETPTPISLLHLLKAPSLFSLFLSYAYLSLHTTTFDQLLPLLGNVPSTKGGLGLPCSLLSLIILLASAISAVTIYGSFQRSIERLGLLRLYRLTAWCFPIVYLAFPLFTLLSRTSETTAWISAASSILLKSIASDFARTLVPLLVLNASPDPYSLASIMGFLHASTALKALSSAGTEVAMAMSKAVVESESAVLGNMLLWGVLAVVGVVGAVGGGWITDSAVVGRDYCAEQLKWEVCYDYAEDGEV